MRHKLSLATLSLIITLLTLTTSSAIASAQPSLSYLSANYIELDDQRSFDGFNFEISGRISHRFFLSGSYAEISVSDPDIDRDITHARLGYLAYNEDSVQFFIGPQLQYISQDIPRSSSTSSDTRYGLFGGAKYQLTPQFEVNAELSYAYIDEGSDSSFFQYSVGGRYYVFSRLSVDARVRFGDFDGFMLGASLHF